MSKYFTILTYLFASLLAIAIVAQSLAVAIERQEMPNNSSPMVEILTDDFNNLKYASGNCTTVSDCIKTGCSQEFCASQEVMSTCEAVTDNPSESGYSCSCVNNYCAWSK